jgi:phospholipid/cholesterol/gamma-HCH transport system permease protein
MICLPLLTAASDVLGIGGAMLIARLDSQIGLRFFYQSAVGAVALSDLAGGLVKSVFFALSLALVACYHGLGTRGGTRGVGRATTETVVVSSVLTLVLDFVLTQLLMEIGL